MSGTTLLELDSRKRVTLGRLAEFDRYLVTTLEGGRLLLEPAMVMTKAELDLLQDEGFWTRAFAALNEPAERLPVDLLEDDAS